MKYNYCILTLLIPFCSITQATNQHANNHLSPESSLRWQQKGDEKVYLHKNSSLGARKNYYTSKEHTKNRKVKEYHSKNNFSVDINKKENKEYVDLFVPKHRHNEVCFTLLKLLPNLKNLLIELGVIQENKEKVSPDSILYRTGKKKYDIFLLKKLWTRYPKKFFDSENYAVAAVGKTVNHMIIYLICKVIKEEKKTKFWYISLLEGGKNILKVIAKQQEKDNREVTAMQNREVSQDVENMIQFIKKSNQYCFPKKNEKFDFTIPIAIGKMRIKLTPQKAKKQNNHFIQNPKSEVSVKLANCWQADLPNTFVIKIPVRCLYSRKYKEKVFIIQKKEIPCKKHHSSFCKKCPASDLYNYVIIQAVKGNSDVNSEETYQRVKNLSRLCELTLPTHFRYLMPSCDEYSSIMIKPDYRYQNSSDDYNDIFRGKSTPQNNNKILHYYPKQVTPPLQLKMPRKSSPNQVRHLSGSKIYFKNRTACYQAFLKNFPQSVEVLCDFFQKYRKINLTNNTNIRSPKEFVIQFLQQVWRAVPATYIQGKFYLPIPNGEKQYSYLLCQQNKDLKVGVEYIKFVHPSEIDPNYLVTLSKEYQLLNQKESTKQWPSQMHIFFGDKKYYIKIKKQTTQLKNSLNNNGVGYTTTQKNIEKTTTNYYLIQEVNVENMQSGNYFKTAQYPIEVKRCMSAQGIDSFMMKLPPLLCKFNIAPILIFTKSKYSSKKNDYERVKTSGFSGKSNLDATCLMIQTFYQLFYALKDDDSYKQINQSRHSTMLTYLNSINQERENLDQNKHQNHPTQLHSNHVNDSQSSTLYSNSYCSNDGSTYNLPTCSGYNSTIDSAPDDTYHNQLTYDSGMTSSGNNPVNHNQYYHNSDYGDHHNDQNDTSSPLSNSYIHNHTLSITNSLISHPNNLISNPNTLSYPNNLISYPNNLISIPNSLTSHPNNLISIPNSLISTPNTLNSTPNSIRSVMDLSDTMNQLNQPIQDKDVNFVFK